jgi:hypothetical protein
MSILVSQDQIAELAEKVDSLAMLLVLRHLQKAEFILNSKDFTRALANILDRLTKFGLIVPGYVGDERDTPHMWVRSEYVKQVLRYFDQYPERQYRLEEKIQITSRASTALALLPEWKQVQVFAEVEDFIQHPDSQKNGAVQALGEGTGLYLLHPSPELRAFVRKINPAKIELFDIIPEETLRVFLDRFAVGSTTG